LIIYILVLVLKIFDFYKVENINLMLASLDAEPRPPHGAERIEASD